MIGPKGAAIDFTENTLTARYTVHSTEEGIVAKSWLKTKSSYRTLPLDPFVRGALLRHREKQEQMKKVMRQAYSGGNTPTASAWTPSVSATSRLRNRALETAFEEA